MFASNYRTMSKQATVLTLAMVLIVIIGDFYIWATGQEREALEAVLNSAGIHHASLSAATAATGSSTATFTFSEVTTIGAPSSMAGAEVPMSALAPVASIPEKLWYKSGPEGISRKSTEWMNTCLEKNPSFRREVLTDATAAAFVKAAYAHRPDIVSMYLALPIPDLKADLLRYLVLFAEGGVWVDLDVACEDVPIMEWVPEQYRDSVGLVVGLALDGAGSENDGSLRTQFASWAMLAKPGSPHLGKVIKDVMKALSDAADKFKVNISGLELQMISDVGEVTGAKGMTRSIVESLSLQMGSPIDDRSTSALSEPKLLGDVLVMPQTAFANWEALASHRDDVDWEQDHDL